MNLKLPVFATAMLLVSGLVLSGQPTASTAKKKSTSGGEFFEINLFGGAHFFKRQDDPPNQEIVNGGLAGFRFTQNIWNYVSLEQTGMVHGTANLGYRIPGTNQDYALGARFRQFHFNPVLHFKPREARIRPFVTMGFGFDYFVPTEDARRQIGSGVLSPFRQVVNLEMTSRPSFNYGGGIKAKLTERIGLRFDMRGFASASPDFGVPQSGPAGAILYTRTTPLSSIQTTGGINFYLGALDQGPVCDFRVGSIEPATNTIWLTEGASFKVPVTNTCMGVVPKYKWTVDGQPVAGEEMIAVKGLKAGTEPVKVVVEADTSKVVDRKTKNYLKKMPIPATERTASLTVKQPMIELMSVNVEPATINFNGSSRITTVIRYDGPSAGEDVTVVYRATDGRLSSSNPNVKVSPDGKMLESTVRLRPGNTNDVAVLNVEGMRLAPGAPSRKVEVDVQVRDQSGKVLGSKSAPGGGLTVTAPPAPPPPPPAPPKLQPIQLDDVVFGKGSAKGAAAAARVNNCGKRILDQVYERAVASGEYDVLLVGHYDAVESKIKVRNAKTKSSRSLDMERALEVAAVLSAGVEPCKRLERSRIKVAYVGAEQLSPFKTSLCEATVKERASGKINAADGNARNRRVEIWLVPKAGPMPNGIAGIQNAPDSDIASKGCPK
jgi:outer membrane protein OmpA-like peptidoglycan-associated protein